MRAAVERQDESRLANERGLVDAAHRLARTEDMSSAQVAKYLGVSLSSIQQGKGGTACLFRARIPNGRSVRHLRARVELHRRNLIERHECGDCDRISFTGPQTKPKAK